MSGKEIYQRIAAAGDCPPLISFFSDYTVIARIETDGSSKETHRNDGSRCFSTLWEGLMQSPMK